MKIAAWYSEFGGKSLILRNGPATVILAYLTYNEQQNLGLLNRNFYNAVLPSIVQSVAIKNLHCNLLDDWLDWGEFQENKKIMKGNVEMDGRSGVFFGEWQMINSQMVPNGRGIFIQGKKVPRQLRRHGSISRSRSRSPPIRRDDSFYFS